MGLMYVLKPTLKVSDAVQTCIYNGQSGRYRLSRACFTLCMSFLYGILLCHLTCFVISYSASLMSTRAIAQYCCTWEGYQRSQLYFFLLLYTKHMFLKLWIERNSIVVNLKIAGCHASPLTWSNMQVFQLCQLHTCFTCFELVAH